MNALLEEVRDRTVELEALLGSEAARDPHAAVRQEKQEGLELLVCADI